MRRDGGMSGRGAGEADPGSGPAKHPSRNRAGRRAGRRTRLPHGFSIPAGLLLVLAAAGAAVALFGGHPARPARPAPPERASGHAGGRSEPGLGRLDPELLYDGSVLAARDLPFLERECRARLSAPAAAAHPEDAAALQRALRTLSGARAAHPGATLFTCRIRPDGLELTPRDWRPVVATTSECRADVVIVGGELSSLSTAMQAADHGLSVAVVYVAPLGGVAADTGANQRYFDCIAPTPHPPAQWKLFHEGLGMHNWFGIPTDVHGRLLRYLQRAYGDRIRLVRTHSYDSLHVERSGRRLAGLLTDEGVRLSGRYYIDSDPDARVAEKSGLPYDIDTPHLSYGMVFDLNGMRGPDWEALRSHRRITPEAILAHLGVSRTAMTADRRARRSGQLLEARLKSDRVRGEGRCWFGFQALAQAFDFYQACRGVASPSPELDWLNARRMVSGFNVCELGSTGTFNSISYGLRKNVLQYSHNLHSDPEFAPIRNTEGPALAAFFRYVTGDPEVSARIPPQLYVRKSTAFFRTLHPYRPVEFHTPPPPHALYVIYALDLRDLHERDRAGWEVVRRYARLSAGRQVWACRASACLTEIDNLFLLNRCGVTPAYSGGLRIEQNQTSTGALLADYLAGLP